MRVFPTYLLHPKSLTVGFLSYAFGDDLSSLVKEGTLATFLEITLKAYTGKQSV